MLLYYLKKITLYHAYWLNWSKWMFIHHISYSDSFYLYLTQQYFKKIVGKISILLKVIVGYICKT